MGIVYRMILGMIPYCFHTNRNRYTDICTVLFGIYLFAYSMHDVAATQPIHG
jgi:hypothetical protein